MSISSEQLQPVAVGSQENRVEALRLLLGYPLKQRDPEGSRFWFLRPSVDEDEAEDTCPIAVGFYAELNHLGKDEISQFLTADEQQNEIYGHYIVRIEPNKPVMYLLLPDGEASTGTLRVGEAHPWYRSGRVAMILPSEGKLRRRQIQSFAWMEQDLQARLNRLRQSELARTDRMQEKALSVIPLVEWAFYKPIETAKELATKLAEVSRKIEQAIPTVYDAERADGYLHTLLTSFQRELLPTLKLKADNDKDYSFADIYAQTISYGLFTARVFSYTVDERKRQEEQNPERKETDFNRQNAWERLPETNPFLRRLFRDVSQQPIAELGEDLADAISEVFSILRAAKMDAILADFRAKMNREDIVIRFYENFLAAYKSQMRERRGVYYTPEPVVSYMVRSVDILLKEKFNKPLGLADPEVMILDPACGTGTFLLWIFKLIEERFKNDGEVRSLIQQKLGDISWSDYVKDHLLPRVFGFELLMAPYAICHLKLGLFLEESGYGFGSSQRLGVYLTDGLSNSLPDRPRIPFEEFIAKESEEALKVKGNEPVMVVIGNPPYSAQSQNLSENARNLINPYRIVDGQKIQEKGALQFEKNLQDDCIKFFRVGQSRIDQTGYGILAFISNHSYLDSPTLRGMRQSLINTFDDIYILDLHGNTKKKECCPDGSKDENVFDVQQGVAISFLIKKNNFSNIKQNKSFYHQSLWGLRGAECSNNDLDFLKLRKYYWLEKETYKTTKWNNFEPISPFYLFIYQNNNLLSEYDLFYQLNHIFPINSSGIITARDSLTIHWQQEEVWDTVNDFAGLTVDTARIKYDLGKDTNDWKIELAQKDLKRYLLAQPEGNFGKNLIIPITYRPFDIRYTYYTGNSKGFHCNPRRQVMSNMISGENLGFATNRALETGKGWHHILCSSFVIQNHSVSIKEGNYFLPLYIYPDLNSPKELQEKKYPNLSKAFLTAITNKLGYTPTPEAIFYYIYAIFHSPTYRTRYAEFLKMDFPRVPLTSDDNLFRKLGEYGEELVALHLMKSPKLDQPITQFIENGGSCIVDAGHPKFLSPSTFGKESGSEGGKVIINKKGDCFIGIPESVWNFYIGGYQVCHKWLKDRKGRTLSPEDITHYQRIVVALQETIRLMQQIDAAIPGFPLP